jgi:hypothetical protein
MRFVSNVTAAVLASALPFRVAPVCIWMLALAMIVPTNVVDVAMVAELVTRQNTLQG